MTPYNATVESGFIGRDGKTRLWVVLDRSKQAVMVLHDAVLAEGKRVKLEGDRIVGVQ